MGGSLSRYHVPPYSVRSRVNSARKPGNGLDENSNRKPRSASGTSATSASIISGTPDTNGSRVSPRPGSSKTQVPPDRYGSMMRIAFATDRGRIANVVPQPCHPDGSGSDLRDLGVRAHGYSEIPR